MVSVSDVACVSGPSSWHQTYPACAGSSQSPINIDRSKVVFSSSLTTFEIPGYETIPRGAHWQLHNNGWTGEKYNCMGHISHDLVSYYYYE